MDIRLECFNVGVALSYGTGYMKQTRDIRRKPIEVYVSRPERVRAVISEWCRPEVRELGRDGLAPEEMQKLFADLLPELARARDEVLSVLQSADYDAIGDQVPTHRYLKEKIALVAYRPNRTLIANKNGTLLKWVPAALIKDYKCGKQRCASVLRAQAEERERRRRWEALRAG